LERPLLLLYLGGCRCAGGLPDNYLLALVEALDYFGVLPVTQSGYHRARVYLAILYHFNIGRSILQLNRLVGYQEYIAPLLDDYTHSGRETLPEMDVFQ